MKYFDLFKSGVLLVSSNFFICLDDFIFNTPKPWNPVATVWLSGHENRDSLPSRSIPLLIEPHLLSRDANKGGFDEEIQELPAINGLHGITQAHMAGTQSMVHVLQPVRHGVDGIDDKPHFTVLDIVFF